MPDLTDFRVLLAEFEVEHARLTARIPCIPASLVHLVQAVHGGIDIMSPSGIS